jgi:hypothetical protein
VSACCPGVDVTVFGHQAVCTARWGPPPSWANWASPAAWENVAAAAAGWANEQLRPGDQPSAGARAFGRQAAELAEMEMRAWSSR